MNDAWDDWQDLSFTVEVDRWVNRTLQHTPWSEQDEPRYGRRSDPFSQEELDKYFADGGSVDYGDARFAQKLIDGQRYEGRRVKRPMLYSGRSAREWDLTNIVTEVLLWWDSSGYLDRHQRIVKGILSKPRNQRRRKLVGLTTRERRHQHVIRLVHALAFDGINQAEYCRRHGLDRGDASRMLKHLYEKEPGLNNAIDAIGACAKLVSWQFRQQQQALHRYMRGVERRQKSDLDGTYSDGRLRYGLDTNRDVIGDGWLTDYDAGGIRSINGGRFKPCALLRGQEDTKPIDLHEPTTWTDVCVPRDPLIFADGRYRDDHLLTRWVPRVGLQVLNWSALHEPARKVERYLPPDRDRELSRRVRLKNGKSATWKPIARGEPSSVGDGKALVYQPRPGTDLNFWSPEQTRYRRIDVSHDYVEPRDEQASSRVIVRWIDLLTGRTIWRRLCNSTRWIPLPFKPTGSDWFKEFSKLAWSFKEVKETSDCATVRIGPGLYRIFLPRR